MIDLHCHLLPGIDDGSQSMIDSLELARASVADGITHAAMTPHIHIDRYDNCRTTVEHATNLFRTALEENDIPLKIFAAGEVRLSADIMDLLEREELPFLGEMDGYRIMLLEFPYGQLPIGSDKLVRWLISQRIRPLIAHPERYKFVLNNVETLAPYVDMGCMLQVTSASVVGGFGQMAQDCATLLIKRGWVSLLATDAHNLEYRKPMLTLARNWLSEHFGDIDAEMLTNITPAKILGVKLP